MPCGAGHETGAGKRTTSVSRLTGKHGEKLSFAFPRAPLSGRTGPEGNPSVEVKGELRGRIRQGGAIDLALVTERVVFSASGVASENGAKQLRMQAGETLRVDLPPAGELLQDDLAGHTFALVIKATAL
jgi:hypothetical protein